ncbi:MAG TPA: PrsW family glutamic-type intramembrane protease [Bacteroidales bacterium]|nr:PrsW family glutamic-type intramembrane protease [Bacteroidales bacterium]HQF00543.1 PrsW family glutamic-type intramembrane protease [Bacteroidales bacterium]HQH13689.1 PrsW family glutamic-type intramembrane protease [Bacteroidales bacterium]HQO07795.1 PrsW family glutamic-type intramembrane protease [Bacteroidales bacterium]HQP53654.1 PrsW family glutamic-type intramembrane protease [Bacteroidales bacterium]
MEKKVLKLFASAYFLGLLTAIPMILVLYFVYSYWLTHVQSLRRIVFYSFVLIGFLSELFKFLLLRFYYLPKKSFTKPFDGILFSVMIAMGYATAANVYFFYEWRYTDGIRIVLYTLPVAVFFISIIMGFFIGLSKFRSNNFDSLTGFSAAVILFGFYSFCLLSGDYLLLSLIGGGVILIAFLLAAKSLNSKTNALL